MATLKHDAQGFLIGEIIASSRDMLAAQQQSMSIWNTIRTDVRAIARAVGMQVATASRTSRPLVQAAIARAPANLQARASRTIGSNVRMQPVIQAAGRRSAVISSPQRASSASTARASVAVPMPARAPNGRFVSAADATGRAAAPAGRGVEQVATPSRDTGGRFLAGEKSGGSAADGAATGGTMGRLTDSIGKLSGVLMSADNVDPTINAAKEISDVISPPGRGLFSMLGKSAERKKERWYSRILKALTPKAVALAPPAVGGSGGAGAFGALGGIGSTLGAVPAMLMGLLTRIFLPIAAIWGSWELGKWIGEKLYKWLDESGVMAKVFDAFDVIGDSFSGAWETVKKNFSTVTAGIEGAWKTITDGFTGALDGLSLLPNKIGTFFTGLDEAMRNLPIVGKAYASATDALKAASSDAKKGFAEGASGNTAAPATGVVQAVARDAGKATTAVKDIGSQVGAGFKAGRDGGEPGAAPTSMAQRAARAVGSTVGAATGWVLGQTSKKFESGNGGAATVSSGKGDNGGASYGTYQLSSKAGTLDKFLKASGYGAQFEGLKGGSAEFNAKWRDVAKNDAGFGTAQHDFIKATHYYPALIALKNAGVDLTKHGSAVQDALWSTSVQFGAGSAKKGDGAFGIFSKALAGKDASKMKEADIVAAVQDYKTENNSALFKRSSAAVQAGTLARASYEKDSLLKLATPAGLPQPARMPAVAVATLPAVTPPNIPSSTPDKIAPMPEMKEPPTRLTSDGAGAGRGSVQVTFPREVGQNVGDRGIAHVVSGGLGG